jgi:segregation and condensation protein B
MDDKAEKQAIEGILFAMGDSVSADQLAKALEIPEKEAERLVTELQRTYEEQDRGIRIRNVNGAYQMSTSKEVYPYLIRLAKQPRKYALTEVLLETLSIIAYKQPVTKAEIEKIRGVSSDHAVNKLVEYGLVQELGRLDAPGRPILFGTTDDFLRAFGISSVEELPVVDPARVEEFTAEAEEEAREALKEEKTGRDANAADV